MKEEKIKEFNVIEYNWTKHKVEAYNVLPYFRDTWHSRKHNFEKENVIDKESLKDWVIRTSRYMFWARCQYECLIAPWPFGSKHMNDELDKFLSKPFYINDIQQNIDFYNIIMGDMEKIDIHQQIMMNIDIVVDILYAEFFKNKISAE